MHGLSSYGEHLKDLERRDVLALKKKLAEMERAKEDMLKFLNKERDLDQELDRMREQDQFEVYKEQVMRRREIDAMEQDIEEYKDFFRDKPQPE